MWDRSEWDTVWSRTQSKKPSMNPEKANNTGDDISQQKSTAAFEGDEAELYEELVPKRAEVAGGALRASDGRLIVRGGRFTQATFGVAYDTFRAEAMPGLAVQFCVALGSSSQQAFRFDFTGRSIA